MLVVIESARRLDGGRVCLTLAASQGAEVPLDLAWSGEGPVKRASVEVDESGTLMRALQDVGVQVAVGLELAEEMVDAAGVAGAQAFAAGLAARSIPVGTEAN